MAQVIFLPGWRQATEEEWARLDEIQDALSMFHINFEYESRTMTELERKELKMKTHFKLRQSITVLQNESRVITLE